DPDPLNVPGEERGGGVPPGETPPDSAQTSATANRDPAAGRNLPPRAVIAFVVIGLFVALFLASAVYLGVRIFT
ncbi:hypothetical protein C6A85_60605, partial [Mycobacterium sp. ITM-2017-0098]